jgi:serralysin
MTDMANTAASRAANSVDVKADASTSQALALGQSCHGLLETQADIDWVKVDLQAGTNYFFALGGDTKDFVVDPFLSLCNADGQVLKSDDNSGSGNYSLLSYQAAVSGSYWLAVRANAPTDTGGYLLSFCSSVSLESSGPSAAPGNFPQFDYEAIANQLTHGYWADSSRTPRAFNVAPGGSISYCTQGLAADEIGFVSSALQAWTDIIGIGFTKVEKDGNIQFFSDDGDSESEAYAYSSVYVAEFGPLDQSYVYVESSWFRTYTAPPEAAGLLNIAFKSYVHEIGHALGLGHAGNYNGSLSWPDSLLFANDSYQSSIMSYVKQNEVSGSTTTLAHPVTPMMADILAMGALYGLSTTTRTGDTVYGFNTNAGAGSVYDFSGYTALPAIAMTLYDSGGVDTLDLSGFTAAQRIDLNAGAFSDVGGGRGNIGIYLTTQIENAIGGSGADTLLGNAGANRLSGGAGADILTGGAGADLFVFNSGSDSGPTAQGWDRIVDFRYSESDRIDLSAIDACEDIPGDQAFSGFVSRPFSAPGQLRYQNGVLYGNTDADKEAEFAIELVGAPLLTLGSVVL